MAATTGNRSILYGNRHSGPLPMHRLKRVERPTTLITDEVQRIDARKSALLLAADGSYGEAVKKASVPFLPMKYPLSAALVDVKDNMASIRERESSRIEQPLSKDASVLSRHIKSVGYFLGADIVGICRLPHYAVYSHDRQGNPIDIQYKNAVVVVMRKDNRTLAASTGNDWIGDAISFQSYTRLALATEIMAAYIKRIGYPASPQNMVSGYQVLLPPLLLWAGIGEVARTGIILNPFLGMAYKAAAILTDMPLEPDMPVDFNLQDFCRLCRLCSDACPSKAISADSKVLYNGYMTWKLKEKNCASYSVTNKQGTICQICAKSCPWTNPLTWPHNTVRRAVQHSRLARRIAIKASQLTGFHGSEDEKWWFDMRYDAEGKLIPLKPDSEDRL